MIRIRNSNGLRARNKMICFPYAGGCASFYGKWKNKIGSTEICPVQLPGREESFRDEKIYDMDTASDQIVDTIKDYVDRDTVFFGHSMGAKIAYEVIRKLEKQGKRIKCLIASGSSAPDIPPRKFVHNLPDKSLLDEIKRLSGTPDELLGQSDLLKCLLPMIRADFTLDETYCPAVKEKITCPIVVWGGRSDPDVDKDDLRAWKEYSYGNFHMKRFDGNHFFINECPEIFSEMSKIIKEI